MQKLSKLTGTGVLVSEYGELVLDQWMTQYRER